jgi:glycosyltransferase involved in cell wall biosynthesis
MVMKIVHVVASIDPAEGGPPQVATRLAAAQASLGHELHLVTYSHADDGGDERTRRQLASIPHFTEVQVHTLKAPRLVEALFAAEGQELLRQLLPGSDWLHLHGVWERILHKAAGIARRLDIPYCFRPSGMLNPWSLGQKRRKKQLALALAVRRVLNRAAFIHCLNSEEAAFVKSIGVTPRPLVLPNGIFLAEIEPLPARGSFVSTYPAVRGRRYVLFLGRLNHVKGLDFLADAFALFGPGVDDVDLVVAGPDDGAKRDFEARIARAGLMKRVHLVGPIYGREKYAALVDAACFCLPSRQEGFSVAIVEALACGLPVVMSAACRFPEAAAAGAADVVPLDASALALTLQNLLAEPERAQAMGRAGRALIRRDYTWPAIAERVTEAYVTTLRNGTGKKGA